MRTGDRAYSIMKIIITNGKVGVCVIQICEVVFIEECMNIPLYLMYGPACDVHLNK